MSLPGFVWSKRGDRLLDGFDPLNAWLLDDGFDFLDLGVDPDDRMSKALDVTVALSTQPENKGIDSDTTLARIDRESSRTQRGRDVVARFQALSPERKFFLPLDRRSVLETNRSRVTEGFNPMPWTAPEGIDPNEVVIVGVIDHAINFAHRRFTNASTGSRVDFAWVQDGLALQGMPVPFGRAWNSAQIDQALADADGSATGALDQLDLINFAQDRDNPLALRLSHGTHVLDLAAGADPLDAAAVNSRIIAVSLPSFVVQETSGGLLSLFFIQGLDFLLRQARVMSAELGRAVPVVVNFSFSVSGGPRDGLHIIERSVDALFEAHSEALKKLHLEEKLPEIYLPAGNRNLSRSHAVQEVDVAGNLALDLPWRLQPADMTSSYLEIWLPDDAEDIIVTIIAPGQDALQVLELNDEVPLILWCENQPDTVLARLSLDSLDGNKKRIFLAVAPTEVLVLPRTPLPAGLWHIRVAARCPNGGQSDAWILRDDTPPGFKRLGQQSYFDDPGYLRFSEQGDIAQSDPAVEPGLVRRTGTSNGLATGQRHFLVSGYLDRASKNARGSSISWLASYSATVQGDKARFIAAVSDTSRVTGGVLAAGTHGGSKVAMNGTSVATPQAVRQRCEDLQSELRTPSDGDERFDHVLDSAPESQAQSNRAGRGLLRTTAVGRLER